MAYTQPTARAVRRSGGRQQTQSQQSSKPLGKYSKGISKLTKSITYSQATNTLLLDIAVDSETASKSAQISAVRVKNDGYVPAHAIFGFTRYTTESDTSEVTEYLNFLLNPNDEIVLPTSKGIIHDNDSNELFDGTVVTATAPNSNEYIDSGENCAGLANTTDPVTLTTTGTMFRVGDLIRVENEIMEVTAIDGGNVTVKRAMFGSDAASHSDATDIRFPFFNAYHDFDKYTVSQTDDLGRFKAMNFFGLGRAASGLAGVTAGSISIQFFESGYQGWNMKGVNSNSESGLTASTEYGFDITVDGSGNLTSDYMKFTTDASNLKFGGSSGIIAKMQAALDTYYYTTSSNILNERVTVSLEGGDVVFRSGSHLSTSAILLAAPSAGETTPFGVGRIPAIGSIRAAVAARLSPETTFDPITNSSTYKQIFIRDDGNGNLIWANERRCGSINYESGAIDFILSEKPNAEFVITCLHTSPFSGKLFSNTAAGDNRGNSLTQVLGNTPQQKCEAILTVETF